MTELLQILRIPEGDIVVTRKVPMTDQTCTELRAIRSTREKVFSGIMDCPVQVPIPTLIQQLIHEEFERIQE